ncbi:YdcF family protein [Pendulispora brunnea]|uniref:YdcF family protein n=1 Tax=Pendulispora brunnea TaxID=2905690 RepID=A0ABZ2KNC9_9BACT
MTSNLRRTLLALVAVLSLAFLGLAIRIDRFGQEDHASPADAMVVLGARVLSDGTPSAPVRARVEKAVDLYKHHLAPVVYFSGGLGDNSPTEAEAMCAYAVSLGLPPSAARLEPESHSTRENAQRTARLLREAGHRRVLVVSDPYHLLRARQYFRLEGFEVTTSPALASDRNVHPTARAYWTMRETAALVLHPSVLLAPPP